MTDDPTRTGDPSLSIDLRFWVMTHLRFDGAWYVFADDARFEDVRAAVQAAWLARKYDFALEIARRYDILRVMCLRCTQRTVTSDIKVPLELLAPPQAWFYVCKECNRELNAQFDTERTQLAREMMKASLK